MANEFYTLIVVPHAKARFRKFQVSVRLTTLGPRGLRRPGPDPVRDPGPLHLDRGRGGRAAAAAGPRTSPSPPRRKAYEENAGQLQAKVLQLQSIVTKLGRHGRGRAEPARRHRSAASEACSRVETTAPSVDIAGLAAEPRPDGRQPHREVRPASRPSSRTRSSCSPRRRRSGRVRGYLSEKLRQPDRPVHRPAATSTRASTSRPRAGRRSMAPADGVVVFCGQKNGYGNAMVIDHGYGVVTRYGHLDGFNVRPGPAGPARRRDRLRRATPAARPRPTSTTRCGSTTRCATRSSTSSTSTGASARPQRAASLPRPARRPDAVAAPGPRGSVMPSQRPRVATRPPPPTRVGVLRRPGTGNAAFAGSRILRGCAGATITPHDQRHPHPDRRHQERARAQAASGRSSQQVGAVRAGAAGPRTTRPWPPRRSSSGSGSRRARPSTTCCPRPSRSCARPAGASSTCATSTCSSSAAWPCTAGRSPR